MEPNKSFFVTITESRTERYVVDIDDERVRSLLDIEDDRPITEEEYRIAVDEHVKNIFWGGHLKGDGTFGVLKISDIFAEVSTDAITERK